MKPLFHIIKWFLQKKIKILISFSNQKNKQNSILDRLHRKQRLYHVHRDNSYSWLCEIVPVQLYPTEIKYWLNRKFIVELTICNLIVFPSRSIVRIFWRKKKLVFANYSTNIFTYKINTDCTDITFGISIILEIIFIHWFLKCLHFQLTANRNRRHDLPTPESPMSNSLKR